MLPVLSFFSTFKTRLIAVAVISLAVFGAYKYVSHLQHELTDERSKNTELTTKLSLQNDAITQMQKDAAARLASHEVELKAAKEATAAAKDKAQTIYKTPPSVPNDSCKSALNLINGGKK